MSGDTNAALISNMEDLLKTLLMKELIDKPPVYCIGENIVSHLQKMEQFFASINVKDEETKQAMLFRSLSDRAVKELKCLPDYDEHP